MTTNKNEILLNGRPIGKVIELDNGNIDVWTSHNLIMKALGRTMGNIEYRRQVD